MAGVPLGGCRIMVVEDDYFIADELERSLESAGAIVMGPFNRAEKARGALHDGEAPAAAILDINVAGELIYPLAEELIGAGVPFVFATGYDDRLIPERFRDVPRLVKPVETARLLSELQRVIVS